MAEEKEIDITEKVKYLLQYGVIGLVVLAVFCAGGVYYYHNQHNYMTVHDAKVGSQMVGVKVKADGKLTEMLVEDGAHVEAGDVIAKVSVTITPEQIQQLEQTVVISQQNLEQLKKGQTVTVPVASTETYNPVSSQALASAESRMHRMQELYEMGAVSAVKRDEAVADYEAAQASVSSVPQVSYQTTIQPTDPKIIEQAELQLKQTQAALAVAKQDSQATEIIAPVSGTVYYSDIQPDTEVKAGQTIARIGEAADIWIEARLDAAQLEKVRLGQFAIFEIGNKEYQGVVQEIVNAENIPEENTANTEAGAPEKIDDGKTVVKITIPHMTSVGFKPGTKAVVKFALKS